MVLITFLFFQLLLPHRLQNSFCQRDQLSPGRKRCTERPQALRLPRQLAFFRLSYHNFDVATGLTRSTIQIFHRSRQFGVWGEYVFS
jgi:hypothetical protein